MMIKQKLTARDLMTAEVKSVSREAPLTEAITLMDANGFSQVPVVDGPTPVALLTEADVRRALLAGRQELPVADLASPLPELLEPGDRISRVVAALQTQEALLVVEGEALRGIITYWDALRFSQPFVMVTEVELVLRRVVSALCERKLGTDWWGKLPQSLREGAEREHHEDEAEPPTPEHMVGHTSFYGLNAIFRYIYPQVTEDQFHDLDRIRVLRNMVAHHYILTDADVAELVQLCFRVGDWLEALLPPDESLNEEPARA